MLRFTFRQPWSWVAAAGLVAMLGTLAWTYGTTPRYVTTLRAANLPLDVHDLRANYPEVAEGENGVPVLMQAADAADALPLEKFDVYLLPIIGDAETPEPEEAFSPEMRTEVLRVAAAGEACFALIYRALEYPAFRYPVKLEDGFAMELGHLARVRGLARMLYLDMLRHIFDGNPEGAARALTAVLRLSNTLAEEPILISQLVRYAIMGIFHEMLAQALHRVEPPDEALRTLREELGSPRVTSHEGMSHAMGTELAWGLTVFQSVDTMAHVMGSRPVEGPYSGAPWLTAALGRATGIDLFSRLVYVRGMRTYIDAGRRSPHEASRVRFDFIEDDPVISWRMPYAAILLPALGRVYDASARCIAHIHIARAALAIELYRGEHGGDAPESLADLAPGWLDEVPLDPFDGEPLRYTRLPDGYVVYSVGHNRKDDGGRGPEERKSIMQDGDILVRVGGWGERD